MTSFAGRIPLSPYSPIRQNIYIFIVAVLDESGILIAVHFSMRSIYQSCDLACAMGQSNVNLSQCFLFTDICVMLVTNHHDLKRRSIHVIFPWAQIGRSAIFGREIGDPDREIFFAGNNIQF